MRRNPRRLVERSVAMNSSGQVLLESLLLAIFLTAFFGLMIAFADKGQKRFQKIHWSKNG